MRVVQNQQMTIGEVDISKMNFDSTSRADIPPILKGLQFVYTNLALRDAIFELLESQVAPKVSKSNGRPGMPLWTILVCGVIRLDLNCDYDRLHELVNQHNSIREMLGHGAFSDVRYHFGVPRPNRRNLSISAERNCYSQSIPAKMASKSIGLPLSRNA